LAEAVRRVAAKRRAVVLANHGPVVSGKSLDDAVDSAETGKDGEARAAPGRAAGVVADAGADRHAGNPDLAASRTLTPAS
jgi:hypothetical protein